MGAALSEELRAMSSNSMSLGPITLRPIVQERIWGVQSLPSWYPPPAEGKLIGEVWLTAQECIADSAAAKGSTLEELAKTHPQQLGGAEFPLLIKLLFPREKLSVQVHPNDAQAQQLGQPRGKTECWYVLDAEPGASVALGFKGRISNDEVREAIVSNTLENKLQYVPVKPGDMVFVDANTVHAIGPGMTVLETQQYSDVTYRLYDYGRPRELHVDAGLAVTQTNTKAGLVPPVEMEGFTRLVSSDYFVVDRFTLDGSHAPLGKHGDLQILVALQDGCFVECSTGMATPLVPGRAIILPAEDVDYTVRAAFAATVIRIAQG